MGVIRARVNLTSAKFPLISKYQGQSVMVGGADINYNPGLNRSEDGLAHQNDVGIPQIIYCENVMPMEEGLQSVGYDNLSLTIANAPASISGGALSRVFETADLSNNFTYFGMITTGSSQWQCVRLNDAYPSSANWSVISGGPIAGYIGGFITTASVNGQTYIFFEGATNPCRQYNFGTNTLDVVTLTNFAANLVTAPKGIFASNGYLCGWSTTRVTWSSTVSVTDFVISLATGAGVTGVQDAKSEIMLIRGHSRGAVIFTRTNAVGMVYSNNKNFPWNFREIAGGGGTELDISVTRRVDDREFLYAYTTAGLQQFTPTTCRIFLPEVTDFLSGQYYESYNRGTEIFTVFTLDYLSRVYMVKKLALIADRYLCISYAPSNLTLDYILVIDVQTQRLGKLKVAGHAEVFEWREFAVLDVRENPKQSIAVMNSLGFITAVSFLPSTGALSGGVLYLGKYQYIRNRKLQLQKITCNMVTIDVLNDFIIKDKVSIDGQNTNSTITGSTLLSSIDTHTSGYASAVGLNHTIMIDGRFYLKSMVMEFNNHGRN